MAKTVKNRAPGNRTITISGPEIERYSKKLLKLQGPADSGKLTDRCICQDVFEVFDKLQDGFADMVFADPPYNLDKKFGSARHKKDSLENYENYLQSWVGQLRRILKEDGSIYICGDWRSSGAIQRVMGRYFKIRNRITWEREKGRGAKKNWKNTSEDIWFGTVSDNYTFNVDNIKVLRRVIAPYTEDGGDPKDWKRTKKGNFRVTHPSNTWTDLTVPFWSMRENTDHPTQKPEKLLAKIILASTNPGDMVFDPFMGAGTACVTAYKLGRHYTGVEIDREFCCTAVKRLEMAEKDKSIQGYRDGLFLERNTAVNYNSDI